MIAQCETSPERLCTDEVNHIHERGLESKGMFREGPQEKQGIYILRGQ